ncbi:hypothetical protein QW180_02535 [Vibrio sinaloensis]|nr:hypothetical protein [Vibrio sinaloensis]
MLKLGYRLRVQSITHPAGGHRPGRPLRSIRSLLTKASHHLTHTVIWLIDYWTVLEKPVLFIKARYDISRWLPGEHSTKTSLTLPKDLESGVYSVEVGLVETADDRPLNLANEGQQSDGWYRLSSLWVW